jgi:hypothetical protein
MINGWTSVLLYALGGICFVLSVIMWWKLYKLLMEMNTKDGFSTLR